MRSFRRLSSLLVLSLALLNTSAAAAEKRDKFGDAYWQHPDFASAGVRSIALLPATSYDHNVDAEKVGVDLFGAAVRSVRYRWVGPSASRTLLMRRSDGDSLLKSFHAQLIDAGRVDSLSARELCARLRTSAVLSLRIDRWEQVVPEFNQPGKPTTTVGLRAALVDSTGRLLWTVSGTQVGEGPYYDPKQAVVGVKASGLGTQPMSNQGKAPSYMEVTMIMVKRWAEKFPGPPESAAPASSAAASDSAKTTP